MPSALANHSNVLKNKPIIKGIFSRKNVQAFPNVLKLTEIQDEYIRSENQISWQHFRKEIEVEWSRNSDLADNNFYFVRTG